MIERDVLVSKNSTMKAVGHYPSYRERSKTPTSLLQGFRKASSENSLLTITIYINSLHNNWYTKEMIDILNYATLMTYDKTGSWTPSAVAPHSPYKCYTDQIEKLITLGFPKDKITPESSYLTTYSDIVDIHPRAENKNKIETKKLYYDGLPMVKQKTQYTKGSEIGGVMIWKISQDSKDASKSILSAIYNQMEGIK